MAEIMLSKNIYISYDEYDFDGFPCNEEEGNFKQYKEKCRKFQNMLQNFKEAPLSNEDTIEEISQDEFLIPEPSGSEDFHEDNAVEMEEIKYEIIENSSKQKGNTMITDSCGFSYSWWRNTNKGSTQEYRCIKRHNPGKKDCKSILKVKNGGEENQKFIRNNDHNHEPDKKLNIKRQMKMDLKKKSIEKRSECPKKVIENVLDSNVQYQNLYDKGFSPKITSMTMTIKRYRKKMSSVNVE